MVLWHSHVGDLHAWRIPIPRTSHGRFVRLLRGRWKDEASGHLSKRRVRADVRVLGEEPVPSTNVHASQHQIELHLHQPRPNGMFGVFSVVFVRSSQKWWPPSFISLYNY